MSNTTRSARAFELLEQAYALASELEQCADTLRVYLEESDPEEERASLEEARACLETIETAAEDLGGLSYDTDTFSSLGD